MGISVEESLLDYMAFSVDGLDFLSGYVLALLQFEDVLLPVDDLHGIGACQKDPDISGFQPAVRGYRLSGFLFVFVVAHEDGWASQPDFSSGGWPSFFVLVIAGIVHLWNVTKLELHVALNLVKDCTTMPPTWPLMGSWVPWMKAAAVFSVCPYPS